MRVPHPSRLCVTVGKSTLLNNLRNHFANNPSVAFVDEPVALWESHGLLKAMYTNELDRCAFQLMAVCTRWSALVSTLEQSGADIIITERSVQSDRACFAAVNLTKAADQAVS